MFVDRLSSFLSGLGGASDKGVGMNFGFHMVSPMELNAMHRSDWLARKVVDIIPNDMTREWRSWKAGTKTIQEIEDYEKRPTILVQQKVNQALQLARLKGGAALYMGVPNQSPAAPLDPETIVKDDLAYLHVLSRNFITCGPIIQNVADENYGEPEYYEVAARGTAAQLRIHPSRVIRFVGAPILDELAATDGWGDSVLQVVYDAITNAISGQQHAAALVPESKVDIVSIPGLSKFLENDASTAKLTSRFQYANQIKSMFRMILLEGNGGKGEQALGETWTQKQIRFQDLPELLQLFLQVAAGAADIPVTRLLGQSPAGMNATGESDIRNYYDNIAARQRTELGPKLHILDEVLIRSAMGSRDPKMWYTWDPLWTLSATDRADIFKKKTEAAGIISSQTLMPKFALSDAFVSMLVEDGTMPALEEAIEKYGNLSDPENEEEAFPPQPDPIALEEAKAGIRAETKPLVPDWFYDGVPRPLYVRRNILNYREIRDWAESQGIKNIYRPRDLHVTIVHSRTPLDWMKISEPWTAKLEVVAGGPRVMEQFGDHAVVRFRSSELEWRHQMIRDAGASHDFSEYSPHFSISEDAGVDLEKIRPFRGKIRLGPEIFEPIKE